MNVEKRYWRWNENLNPTQCKLRCHISELLDKGLVNTGEEPDEYTGVDEFPWSIKVSNQRIVSIFFRNRFFPLGNIDLWDLS